MGGKTLLKHADSLTYSQNSVKAKRSEVNLDEVGFGFCPLQNSNIVGEYLDGS